MMMFAGGIEEPAGELYRRSFVDINEEDEDDVNFLRFAATCHEPEPRWLRIRMVPSRVTQGARVLSDILEPPKFQIRPTFYKVTL